MKLQQELTRDNHFQFGYDDKPFTFRQKDSERWSIRYGKCQRPILDWRAENVKAAHEIHQRTQKPIYVCMSGGLDSEVVAESFRQARIPFRCAITRFQKGLNIHDIAWAVTYCESYDIEYEFMDLDIEDFYLGGEIWNYASDSLCIFPMLTPTMKLMEWVCQKGGFPILGSADTYVVRTQNNWAAVESEPIAAMFRFQMVRGLEAQAGFFIWSPEQILAFLMDPVVRRLTANQMPGFANTAQIKHKIYSQYYPRMSAREKYLGLEKIRELDALMNKKLEASIIVGAQAFHYPVHQLIKDLAPL